MSSSTGEIGIIILLVVAGLLAVWLAIKLFRWALAGALYLLAFAGEQGFIGLAAYIACWVFLFPPAMLVISIIIGIVTGAAVRAAGADVREEERIRKTRRQLGLDEE